MRTLHWVTKIGSLKNSLRFYELVFGLRVLRHEEFESGCEATCNGPYGGAWSKTMVGLGNENSNFVFELTYNYGIDSYASGNDVQYFAIAMPEAVPRATALGYAVDYVQGMPIINGPDGFRYCRTHHSSTLLSPSYHLLVTAVHTATWQVQDRRGHCRARRALCRRRAALVRPGRIERVLVRYTVLRLLPTSLGMTRGHHYRHVAGVTFSA